MGAELAPTDGTGLDRIIDAQLRRFRPIAEKLKINPGG